MQILAIKAEPLSMGHAVKLSWKSPTSIDFKEVVIHRRNDDFNLDPASVFSVEIYRGTGETCYDYHLINPAVTKLEDIPKEQDGNFLIGEKIYYYTFFAVDKDNNYYATLATTSAVAPTKKYGMGTWLYNQYPQIYRSSDKTLTLKRLYDLFGEQFGFIYSMIMMSKNMYDPLKVNPKWLPHLAEMVGWKLDYTLPLSIQRRLVKNAVAIYKYAGTKKGLDALVKYYSGFPSTSGVYELHERLHYTVYFGFTETAPVRFHDHIVPDFRDIGEGGMDFSLINTVDDPLHYFYDFGPGAVISQNIFVAYVQKTMEIGEEEEQIIRDRITRILDEFKPVNTDYIIEIY